MARNKSIPLFKPSKRKARPARKGKSLAEAAGLKTVKAPSKQEKPATPSSQMPKKDGKRPRSLASGLASAAMAMPSGGYPGVLKSALAGAAAGAEIETSYRAYKAERKKKKAKKATTTVSQSAMQQKKQYHKKDPTKTKRV